MPPRLVREPSQLSSTLFLAGSERLDSRSKVGRRAKTTTTTKSRKYPSKWNAASAQQDPVATVRIVDRFVILRTANSGLEASN
ncbi:hypothetical protein GIB67_011271 [Kingdonia uniflora]|uniref:Uncharacterized protein n=1 Tax=Kingdonia uniflora TaxID=39325 RepID=A0A7J7N9X1_9MAGN|nr:hypothetical protein GIB67_011271 [Kingdonia uniflora]